MMIRWTDVLQLESPLYSYTNRAPVTISLHRQTNCKAGLPTWGLPELSYRNLQVHLILGETIMISDINT